MPCFFPQSGYRKIGGGFTFTRSNGYSDLPLTVPCGKCIGCRSERARQWSARVMHETSESLANMFLTLTYDDLHLPLGGTLVKTHLQEFHKRLRSSLRYKDDTGRTRYPRLSYFGCGEYGDKLERPHYHTIVFGYSFPDKREHGESKSGHKQFKSAALDKLWGKGRCVIGSVTPASAQYIAQYTFKKVRGEEADEHYQGKLPEFLIMSTRPAIGKRWIERNHHYTYKHDQVVLDAKPQPVPRYYDKLLQEDNPTKYRNIKYKRTQKSATPQARANATPERLATRNEIKTHNQKLFKRDL